MRNNLNCTLQEKRKVTTVHGYMLYAIILYVAMFYTAIWPNLLLVFYCHRRRKQLLVGGAKNDIFMVVVHA